MTIDAPIKPIAVPVAVAGNMLGIKPTKTWQLIRQGRLQTITIDTSRRVLVESINQLIEQLKQDEVNRPKRRSLEQATRASVAARAAHKRKKA
jgi:hypothetical protein